MGNLATPLSTARAVTPLTPTKPASRILVVEDDPAVQKALRRLFETEGYSVETQSDGKSALESFQIPRRRPLFLTCDFPSFRAGTCAKRSRLWPLRYPSSF